MKKKVLSVLLSLLIVCSCLLPAVALKECGTISVRLNSNIAGLTKNDVQKLIELRSDNVKYGIRTSEPIGIANYAGSSENGKLVAGRSYTISYYLSAADGYVLPDQLSDSSLDISCGKGVSVISKSIVTSNIRLEDGSFDEVKGIRIFASVVVDGNFFQRLTGLFYDFFLKVKAFQLY